jgi:endogenous inhibitor of DNA gyrase (YacG/DUF329 family)
VKKPRHVACPTCGREIEWTEEQRWRPFCSERCQLIDLGAWFEEKRAVPGESVDVQVDDLETGSDKPQH